MWRGWKLDGITRVCNHERKLSQDERRPYAIFVDFTVQVAVRSVAVVMRTPDLVVAICQMHHHSQVLDRIPQQLGHELLLFVCRPPRWKAGSHPES